MVVTAAQKCQCADVTDLYTDTIVKMVNFILYVFYHNWVKKKKTDNFSFFHQWTLHWGRNRCFLITEFPGPHPEPGPSQVFSVYEFSDTCHVPVSYSSVSPSRAGAPFLIFICLTASLLLPSTQYSRVLIEAWATIYANFPKALEFEIKCLCGGTCVCTRTFYCISAFALGARNPEESRVSSAAVWVSC